MDGPRTLSRPRIRPLPANRSAVDRRPLLSLAQAPHRLHLRIARQYPGFLTFSQPDFSEAEFVDSSIINLLVETKRSAEASQRRFCIQMGTECVVHRVFQIAGVLSFLGCVASREEALGD